ncbi:trimeric intracellular cation channel family protein [Salinibius halmophilus]|uniref:trimeric intracellular cation channel family protein n=1 Tax=Salinibius halmophilus TaxID=1853216 RepID=UPI000E6744C4|nr:trimeric intracellular cation channel family protein [Salinibius halmophilus]
MNEILEVSTVVFWLDLFGVAVFAAAGALEAGRARFDFFGVQFIAVVTALGGGTLRNLVLGLPASWVDQTIYMYVALFAGAATFIADKYIEIHIKTLLYADALGLAVFVVTGMQVAFAYGADPLIAIIMGMSSGIVGGILRDVFCNEVPLIFQRDIYATPALAGGVVFWLGTSYLTDTMAIIAAIVTCFGIRSAGIYWHLSLPRFLHTVHYREENRGE